MIKLMGKEYLTTSEVAEICGGSTSRQDVCNWVAATMRGNLDIPFIRHPVKENTFLFPKEEFMEWLKHIQN